MNKDNYYWDDRIGAWKKLDNAGMITLFPFKNYPGWLLCNGSIINRSKYKRLVDLLKKEEYIEYSTSIEITFNVDGKFLHPLNKTSKYFEFSTFKNNYCVWYSVGNTGKEPNNNKQKVQVNVPLSAKSIQVAKMTCDMLKEKNDLKIDLLDNKIVLSFLTNSKNVSIFKGLEKKIIKDGKNIFSSSYFVENLDECRLPCLDMIGHCYYMIRT